MKLLDKIKDLFMDEVDVDDEIEIEEEEKIVKTKPKKEENVLPKVMRETIKREENIQEKVEKKVEKNIVSEPEKKFNFPIDFELDVPSRSSTRSENINSNITLKNTNNQLDLHRNKADSIVNNKNKMANYEKTATDKLNELYAKKEVVQEKPKFKATPVISPVYGVLDKNYKKDEVKERSEEMVEMKRPSKKVDFETVRKKAFGNLADDIKDNLLCENCELYKEVKKISELKEGDLLYDMTVDEKEDVTIERAYDNYAEFGVAYEPKNTRSETNEKEFENAHSDKNVDSDRMRFDDIINNVNKIDEAVINDSNEFDKDVIHDKPDTTFDNKVDEDELLNQESLEKNEEEQDVPKRSEKKKDEKVDDDFFELIDSMYKERTDE